MTEEKRQYWDSVAADWASHNRHHLWRRHSDAVNTALLRRWLPAEPVERLLKTDLFDEAVCDGLVPSIRPHATQIVGIDLSPGIVSAVEKRFPEIEANAADTRHLPFGDASIDRVVSISTLDHFESTDQIPVALKELARVLRPGGELLLTLDNLAHPVVWLRSVVPQRLLLRLGLVPYEVGATCRPRRLREYCREAGLEVLEMSAALHCPRVLAVALSRLAEQRVSEAAQDRFLGLLMAFEKLERLPTRYLTGHFTAVRARKPVDHRTRSGTPAREPEATEMEAE